MAKEEWSLREFRALHAVITQGSITAAAQWLGMSQPAVSRAVAALEAKIGHTLFERNGRSVKATSWALTLNNQLMPFFAVLDDMSAAPRMSLGSERLRIGAPPAFCTGYLQAMIGSFLEINPQIHIELDVLSSAMIIAQVSNGELELGVSDMKIESVAVSRRQLCVSHMMCILPDDHPLAQRPEINAADLVSEKIIGLSRRHYARRQLDKLLEDAGLANAIAVETSSTVSAVAFVERGLGLALMNPFPAGLFLPPKLTMVPVRPSIAYATSVIMPLASPMKPAASNFARHLSRSLPRRAWIGRGGHASHQA